MPVSPRDITEAELNVLDQLWRLGQATNRQLTDAIYPDGPASRYSTVKKLLERLEAKRFVKRKRSGSVYVFRALVDRKELIGRRLNAVAESLCDGSLTPLLEHLVEAHNLTKDDRKSLQEMIDHWDEKKTGKKRK